MMDAGAHEQADDVVALLFEQEGCDGAIDAAAHGQDDARGHGNPRRNSSLIIRGLTRQKVICEVLS